MFKVSSHLVIRAHLVRELNPLDGDLAAESVVVEAQSAVDIDVRKGVHEAEHSLGRARRPRETGVTLRCVALGWVGLG